MICNNNKNNNYQTIILGGEKFSINTNPRLHIKMTDACNGNCPFCVAKLGKLRNENIIDNLAQKLKIAIEKLNVKNIVLLGGEPTISKNLFPILNELEKYKQNLDEITIITNGVKLRDEKFLLKLAHSPINVVNISIHHWNKKINSNLMHIDSLLKDELIKIKDILNKNGIQVWLSVVMMKNYIDSTKKMLHYIKYYAGVADLIKFIPISSTEEHETIKEVSQFTKSHLIDNDNLKAIVEETMKSGNKINLDPKKYNLDQYSSANIYNQQVVFKFTEIHKDKDDQDNNFIYSIKLLPTGKLTNTYHDRGLDFYELLK